MFLSLGSTDQFPCCFSGWQIPLFGKGLSALAVLVLQAVLVSLSDGVDYA